ncbi:Cof subfamily protein (haloacid dehalogenase superfamily) [Arthrobacter stackebrandtii]|uniref:Cof subfamily protein (Haloacid dehalogenase superfamily) n=1 Tax=Arthrobacter stackebrandtii TaxID=272161 RepID=A0ABS4YXV8_9MICC|nr:HAD family hydrolase [Arthrobacter stackebrandtii]MBP2412843.1 Cof subfamily protein (haloacid dehalogenase superfamily) [Arthrobacter stackebrandtii]PYH01339.1 HAD family hydrolase [Arthrobacter stackebrandtii]
MTMTANTAITGIDDRTSQKTQYLVALDVDGTLVDHDGGMTDSVRAAAQAVVEAGNHVIIATGRSLGAVLPVVEMIGMRRGYAVCSNGGVTIRLDPELPDGYEVIHRETFDPAPALTALRDKIPGARFALEDAEGNFLATSRFQDDSFGIAARGVDFHHLLEAEAVRVVVNSAEASTDAFAEAIAAAGLHGVTYAIGWSAWLDIAAEGVTKASALEVLRAELGVDRSLTVAVGDGTNDLEMLQWAGRGVAMGQSIDVVKAAADEVAGSVYDDGLVPVLRSLL